MEPVMMFTLGVIVGFVLCAINAIATLFSGTLKIDHSNDEKDVYRLEIDNFDNLDKRRYIILSVDHNADLSQK